MEKELQIIRLPRKYADILQILSLEEKWKILDSILYYNEKEIELNWTTKTLFELIKVDLDNLHKIVLWWQKWGRPKKEKPEVIENEKPQVIENIKPEVWKNENQKKRKEKKRKEIKIKENKINNTISKEIEQSSEIEIVKEDKRDMDIDIIIETLKNLNLGIIDDTIQKQRQYWKLIKQKMNKIKWFKWNYQEFIIMLYENSDEYRKNHFRSLEKFYREMANIITWIKIQAEKKQIRRWC